MKANQNSDSGELQEPTVRLQKALAAAGLGSRRACEDYILAGRVSVDGQVITDLGRRVDPYTQRIEVDGELLKQERKLYFLLNKPRGVLCTNHDPAGRPRAVDLIPATNARLFTVGRLDENSEGLLIVTNDGELANRLAHPRFRIPKTYQVQVAGIPSTETLAQLRKGMRFSDGFFRVQHVRRLRKKGQSAFLEIVLSEGRNREIRRLLAKVGHKVIQLKRVALGSLQLGRLATGRYRPLKAREIQLLTEMAHPAQKRRATGQASTPSKRRKQLSRPTKAGQSTVTKSKARGQANSNRPESKSVERSTPTGRVRSLKTSARKARRGKRG